MSEWTKRQHQLLEQLRSDQPLSGKELARRLQVSERTIRNEVAEISRLDPDLITAVKGKGYLLARTEELETTAAEESTHRQYEILRALIKEESVDLFDLADELYISESTLLKDVAAINEIISARDETLHIFRKNNQLLLTGSNRTQATGYFLLQEFDAWNFNLDAYEEFFDGFSIQQLEALCTGFIHQEGLVMKDMEVISFVMHMAVLIDRCLDGSHTRTVGLKPESTKLARKFAGILDEQFDLALQETDIEFIACLFSDKTSLKETDSEPKMQVYVDHLLQEVQDEFGIDFTQDQTLRHNLLLHFLALKNRLETGSFLNNPLIQDIRTHFPLIHDIAVYMAYRIEHFEGARMSEGEIGYLTLHLLGAVERLKKEPRCRIAIISPIGESLNGYIRSRLQAIEGAAVCGFVSVYDADSLKSLAPDLVITLGPVSKQISCPVYTCHGMLSDEDIERIRDMICQLNQTHQSREFFEEDLFFPGLDLKTRQEIIHFLCESLKRKQIIDENYEQLILRREELAPTAYGGGFAIPHPVKKEARLNRLAVCTLKNPVLWNTDKVRVVFLLTLSLKRDENFELLFEQLVNLMDDRSKVRALSRAETLSDFLSIFEQEEIRS